MPASIPTKEREPGYVLAAEDFFGAVEQDRLKNAYAVITDGAQELIQYAQFASQFKELELNSHRIVADTASDEVAYVMASVDTAPPGDERAEAVKSFGLLLKRTGDGWRVSSWAPQVEAHDAYPGLSLAKVADGQFTVTYTGPQGALCSLTVVEFRP